MPYCHNLSDLQWSHSCFFEIGPIFWTDILKQLHKNGNGNIPNVKWCWALTNLLDDTICLPQKHLHLFIQKPTAVEMHTCAQTWSVSLVALPFEALRLGNLHTCRFVDFVAALVSLWASVVVRPSPHVGSKPARAPWGGGWWDTWKPHSTVCAI